MNERYLYDPSGIQPLLSSAKRISELETENAKLKADRDKLVAEVRAVNENFSIVGSENLTLSFRVKALEEKNAELVEACEEAVKLLENPQLYPSDCQPAYGMLRGAIHTSKRRLDEIIGDDTEGGGIPNGENPPR